jgi:hypothetical protein
MAYLGNLKAFHRQTVALFFRHSKTAEATRLVALVREATLPSASTYLTTPASSSLHHNQRTIHSEEMPVVLVVQISQG